MQPIYYAVGDIHGRADLLAEAYDLIGADIYLRGPVEATIVFLGDYGDSGRRFRAVLDMVRRGMRGAKTVRLRGNHEQMLLDFLGGADEPHWYSHYARDLAREMGVDFERVTPDEFRKSAVAYLGEENLAMLRSTALFHHAPDVDALFVHAGLRPGVELQQQTPVDLMRIRRGFIDTLHDFGPMVIHGHTSYREPQFNGFRLGIDTGAANGGALTVAAITLDSVHFLQTGTDDPAVPIARRALAA